MSDLTTRLLEMGGVRKSGLVDTAEHPARLVRLSRCGGQLLRWSIGVALLSLGLSVSVVSADDPSEVAESDASEASASPGIQGEASSDDTSDTTTTSNDGDLSGQSDAPSEDAGESSDDSAEAASQLPAPLLSDDAGASGFSDEVSADEGVNGLDSPSGVTLPPAMNLPAPLSMDSTRNSSSVDEASNDAEDMTETTTPRGIRLVDSLRGPFSAWTQLAIAAGSADASSVWSLSPEIGARFRVAQDFRIDIAWGMVGGEAQVVGEAEIDGRVQVYDERHTFTGTGNAVLRFLYDDQLGPVMFTLGAGVGLPMAARPETTTDASQAGFRQAAEFVYRSAGAARGWWSPWRFAPERATLFIPSRMAWDMDAVHLAVDTGVGLMFPVIGDRSAPIDTIVQGAFDVEALLLPALSLGMRVSVQGNATGIATPEIQAAVSPTMTVHVDPVHLSFRGTLNFGSTDSLGDDGIGVGGIVVLGVSP